MVWSSHLGWCGCSAMATVKPMFWNINPQLLPLNLVDGNVSVKVYITSHSLTLVSWDTDPKKAILNFWCGSLTWLGGCLCRHPREGGLSPGSCIPLLGRLLTWKTFAGRHCGWMLVLGAKVLYSLEIRWFMTLFPTTELSSAQIGTCTLICHGGGWHKHPDGGCSLDIWDLREAGWPRQINWCLCGMYALDVSNASTQVFVLLLLTED